MSIFISIAAYRDEEIKQTVQQLIDNADKPNELYFGIVTQDEKNAHPDFRDIARMKHLQMDWSLARGAGLARKLAMNMYDGQDYFFQTDSHMLFSKGWDTDLIRMLKQAQSIANNKKVILSQFPAAYGYDSNQNIVKLDNDPDLWDYPSWTSVAVSWAGCWSGNRERIEDLSQPHVSHTVLGAMIFAPGNICFEVPYDERVSFMGEEICFVIRAFTRGWDIYAPNKMVAWHHYTRKQSPKIWNDKTENRNWIDIENNSQNIQKDILLGIEKGIYGIQDYQRYLDYQNMIGIDFNEFYNSGKIDENLNNSLLVQEVTIDGWGPKISNFCIKDMHDKCLDRYNCECDCHEGAK